MNLTGVNEETLWNNVIAGDQQAFSTLYEASADMLYAYALRYFPDKEMIKDCIHDLFTDLYLQRANLARKVNIKFYLLVSFRRKLNVSLKKSSLLSFPDDMSAAESRFQLTFEADNAQSRIIAQEEQRAVLQRLAVEMNKLPARQKEILYLKYNCELSYEEIAILMNITVPTCRTLAYRAIRQLRQDLPATSIPVFGMMLFIFLKNF